MPAKPEVIYVTETYVTEVVVGPETTSPRAEDRPRDRCHPDVVSLMNAEESPGLPTSPADGEPEINLVKRALWTLSLSAVKAVLRLLWMLTRLVGLVTRLLWRLLLPFFVAAAVLGVVAALVDLFDLFHQERDHLD